MREEWKEISRTTETKTYPTEERGHCMNDLGLVRLAFALGSEVRIRGTDLKARVLIASVTIRGVVYQCAYWNDKSRTEVWFEEFELEAVA